MGTNVPMSIEEINLFDSIQDNDLQGLTQLLVDVGVSPNIINDKGTTPLIASINAMIDVYTGDYIQGSDRIVIALLKAGANVNATDIHGDTPLLVAVQKSGTVPIGIVQLLLDYGANPNIGNKRELYSPLQDAITSKNASVVNVLITAGANINQFANINSTPLLLAIKVGDLDIVNILLNAGAQVNAPDTKGDTPILIAASIGNAPLVKLLLKAGANPNFVNKFGDSPLSIAVVNGNVPLVLALINSRANVNFKKGLQSLLTLAAQNGHAVIVDLLLNAGATAGKDTALLYAVKRGDTEMARLLVDEDAQLLRPDLHASRLQELLSRDACADKTMGDLQVIAANTGINIYKDSEGEIPKLKDELCFDINYFDGMRKLLSMYTFGAKFEEILSLGDSTDGIPIDRLPYEGSLVHLNNQSNEPSKEWYTAQKDYLTSNKCMGFRYCDIVRGYTHHGDKWVIAASETGDGGDKLVTEINTFNETHQYTHSFHRIINYLTQKFGLGLGTSADKLAKHEHYKKLYTNAILEIAKNLVYIIQNSPPLTGYVTVYRGEDSEYPGFASVGRVFVNTRFMSTSTLFSIGADFARKVRLLRILLPPGTHALSTRSCTTFEYEREILLPPKCMFVVFQTSYLDKAYDADGNVISLMLDLLLIREPQLVSSPLCEYETFSTDPNRDWEGSYGEVHADLDP